MRLLILNAIKDPSLESVRKRFPGKLKRRPLVDGRPLAPEHRRVLTHDKLTLPTMTHLLALQKMGNVRVYCMGRGGEAQVPALMEELGLAIKPPEPVLLSDDERMAAAMIYVAGLAPEKRAETIGRNVDGSVGWYIEDEQGIVFVPQPEEPGALEDDDGLLDELHSGDDADVGGDDVPDGGDDVPDGGDDGDDPGPDDDVDDLPAAERISPAEEAAEVAPEAAPSILDQVLADAAEDAAAAGVLAPAEEVPEAAPASAEVFVLPEDFEARLKVPRVVTNEERRGMLTVLGGSGTGLTTRKLVRAIMDKITAEDVDPVAATRVLDMLSAAEQ